MSSNVVVTPGTGAGIDIPAESLARYHAQIGPALVAAFQQVLGGPRFTLGPQLAAFEEEFAAYCRAHAAVGTSSGTSALWLALRALGVGPGDEVITVPNTYVATAFAITYVGAVPVFVDVDPVTFNMDPECVAAAVGPRTKAVVPVHLYGQCADVDAIRDAAPGIPVLEDAAHAHGADLRGRRAGSLGEAAAFSFYPTKVMGALGDGGIITVGTSELDSQLRQLRYMGQKVKHDHEILGYQERLDEVQAAFLRVKLDVHEQQIAGRRHVADRYREVLAGSPLTLPTADVTGRHVYYMYTVLADERDALAAHLTAAGIGTQVVYPRLVPDQGAYRDHPWRAVGDLAIARTLPDRLLNLPMWAELTDDEIDRVGAAVRSFYGVA
ncbi:MAG TPA: DegT/DnrJ/EryC1/StrS family aminotransferase [Actinomycetes bacterium]|nr:DegT/DnrJ/EryC1/StrS family aminotransferase [Actinomycetes bacterium]